MIHSVKGKLVEKSPVHVVIDTGGLAYHLHISLNTYGKLRQQGDALLFTHLNINGNDFSLQLFGFAVVVERYLVRKLLSGSGVGPNTARMVLSGLSPSEVKNMIAMKDVAGFRRIKGIGEKTAERIMVDLHDKIMKSGDISTEKISAPGSRST